MAMESDIFQMYLREMAAIEACDAAENAALALRAAAGDDAAKSRLIEGNLNYVLELSRDFSGSGVPASDLVQEANMALLMAVEEYDPAEGAEMTAYRVGRFETFLASRVRAALTAVVDEHKAQRKIGEKVLGRVNHLQDVSKEMAEELGREATVAELAQRLAMTEEEVKDIMKVALDALKALGEE